MVAAEIAAPVPPFALQGLCFRGLGMPAGDGQNSSVRRSR
jgi:hypothetical protein